MKEWIVIWAIFLFPPFEEIPYTEEVTEAVSQTMLTDISQADDLYIYLVEKDGLEALRIDIGVGNGNGWQFIFVNGNIIECYFDTDPCKN